MDVLTRDFRGNHVVLRHAENEYTFLAHLIPGSIAVAEGERVERGQFLGRCGNSGYSTEPHLHFHVQDRANMWFAAGLPIQFSDLAVDDEPAGGPTYIQGGTFVAPLTTNETVDDTTAPRSH